jgi:hypothetical protein
LNNAVGGLRYGARSTEILALLAFYLTVFGGFVCLIPLAIYCMGMAGINRRPHPILISGVADLAWALLGLSGFLVVGGPLVLSGLRSAWRLAVFRGSFAAVEGLLDERTWPWILLWFVYFGGIVALVIAFYRRRRAVTIAMNLDPALAMPSISETCARLDLPIATKGARLVLGGAARSAVVDVRPAPVLRSATLTWQSDPAEMRPIVESELRRILAGLPAPENPLPAWLLTAAGVLFCLQIVAFALFILFLYYTRH